MLQSFGLAALAFMHHPPVYGFFALALLGGVFLAFDNPVRRSFVNEMVSKDEIPNAVTLYGIIVNGSRVFGPALAGILVISIGYGWCFTLDAFSYLIVIGCILRMRVSELFLPKVTTKVRGSVLDGIRYIKATPELWITFLLLAVIGIFSYNFTVTLPLLVTVGLHGSTREFTTLYSVFSLGSVLGGVFIARKRLVEVRHVVIGAFAIGGTMVLLSLAPNIVLAMPAVFLLGVSTIVYMTATTTLMQVKTKPEMIGRILALQSVLMFGTTPIGGPLLGWLADFDGGRSPVLLGGIAALVTGIFGYIAVKRFAHNHSATGVVT
jgi:MFS family permease